jgi:hypothetical protein
MVTGGSIALVIQVGVADGYIITKYESKSLNASQDLTHNGTAIYDQWNLRQVYINPVTGDIFESVGTYGHSTGNYDASGCSSGGSGTSIVTSSAKQSLIATLHSPGNELTLYSSTGGTDGGLVGGLAGDWQASGTMSYGGWLPYIDTGIYDPPPYAIYSRESAVDKILESCMSPGCGGRVATDDSAGITEANTAMWVGNA